MKASEVTKDAILYYQKSKYGYGQKVRVIDPRPVYGRVRRYGSEVAEGRGTGVLVELVDWTNKPRVAAQLRQLIGPYAKVLAAEREREKAAAKAEDERRKRVEQLDREGRRLERRAREVGISAYAKNSYDRWVTVSIPANQFVAMLDALPEGWTAPGDPEEA